MRDVGQRNPSFDQPEEIQRLDAQIVAISEEIKEEEKREIDTDDFEDLVVADEYSAQPIKGHSVLDASKPSLAEKMHRGANETERLSEMPVYERYYTFDQVQPLKKRTPLTQQQKQKEATLMRMLQHERNVYNLAKGVMDKKRFSIY